MKVGHPHWYTPRDLSAMKHASEVDLSIAKRTGRPVYAAVQMPRAEIKHIKLTDSQRYKIWLVAGVLKE